jgi:hypothetical protein
LPGSLTGSLYKFAKGQIFRDDGFSFWKNILRFRLNASFVDMPPPFLHDLREGNSWLSFGV